MIFTKPAKSLSEQKFRDDSDFLHKTTDGKLLTSKQLTYTDPTHFGTTLVDNPRNKRGKRRRYVYGYDQYPSSELEIKPSGSCYLRVGSTSFHIRRDEAYEALRTGEWEKR